MRPSATTIGCALLVCWLLSACSQWRYDLGVPLDTAAVPPQNATLAEALQVLGPPVQISASAEGYVLAWEHWRIYEDSLGFSLGALGAEFMSADWGEMRIKGEFLLLTFNEQHRMTSATLSQWDNHGGGGKAVQPFFGFISVVDVDDLTHSMPQHRWGSSLLQRLPGTLNTGSSLDTGQSGLQQRGTPTAAGQQSLGMD